MNQFFYRTTNQFFYRTTDRADSDWLFSGNELFFFNNEFHELNEFCDGFAGVALRFCTLSAPA